MVQNSYTVACIGIRYKAWDLFLNFTSCNLDGKHGSAVSPVALQSLPRWQIVGPFTSNWQAFVALLQLTRVTGGSRAIPNSVVIVLAFGEILVLNERRRRLGAAHFEGTSSEGSYMTPCHHAAVLSFETII